MTIVQQLALAFIAWVVISTLREAEIRKEDRARRAEDNERLVEVLERIESHLSYLAESSRLDRNDKLAQLRAIDDAETIERLRAEGSPAPEVE